MARLIRTEVAGTVAPHGLRDALATRLFVCLVQSERTYYWKHMVLEPLGSVAGLEEQPVGCGRREVIRVGRAVVMQRDHVEGGVEYGRRYQYCLGLRKSAYLMIPFGTAVLKPCPEAQRELLSLSLHC